MLIESLIRLGKPFISTEPDPREVILTVTNAGDERLRFYERVYLVEVRKQENKLQVAAHPHSTFGNHKTVGKKEVFFTNRYQSVSIPVVIPQGGSPVVPQGKYAVPAYLTYDSQFKKFSSEPTEIVSFLAGRLGRAVVDAELGEADINAIAEALHPHFLAAQEEDAKGKILGIVTLILLGGSKSPYTLADGVTDPETEVEVAPSRLEPGQKIIAHLDKIAPLVWDAKLEEGAEQGRLQEEDSYCSFCSSTGEVVSAYCKAWPWFTTTWEGPLPLELDKKNMVESIALCKECYSALTFGANLFSSTVQALPFWLTKEIFSPSSSPAGRQLSRERRGSPEPIYGGMLVLPVPDNLPHESEEVDLFLDGIRQMAARNKGSALDRHLQNITGFETLLPEALQDDLYRLNLLYYSGNPSRADIHLRASIEDVLPSVATRIDDLLQEMGIFASKVHSHYFPPTSRWRQENYASLFYLLVTAYGAGYLWSGLSTVLHRRPLTEERFVINAVLRMQELSRKLPDSIWELRREILFYLVFREFLSRYNEEISEQGGLGMRPWQELADVLSCAPLELKCEDVEELGFAVGNVIREFSRWYWMSTRSGAEGKGRDFIKHRVMKFHSRLTPDLIWREGLARLGEYALKLDMGIPAGFKEKTGIIITEFSRLRDEVEIDKDKFTASFWAGYALQGAGKSETEKEIDTETKADNT
jgi:hypothetical protein